MRVSSIHLKNFKRFTDLKIEEVPESAKLVLLIGANGSGKSSLFDAFNLMAVGKGANADYHRKDGESEFEISLELQNGNLLVRKGNNLTGSGIEGGFLGRSSNRVAPRIQPVSDSSKRITHNSDGPSQFIDDDRRVFADVAAFASSIDQALRAPTFEGLQADTVAIFKEHIDPFNAALRRIFGESSTTTAQIKNYENADPSKSVQLFFQKGESVIPFDLLSHGEKQVVVLLLGFLARRKQYSDTIYFIDEMDLHLNTALQKTVIKEIVENWIPERSQLWTATHALGFIEYANESEEAVILDFDMLDFDLPQRITPAPRDGLEVFEIAIPRESISKLLGSRKLIYCEGKDHQYYNAALDDESALFIPSDNADQVFRIVTADASKAALRDRDFLMDREIEIIQEAYPNYLILPYYSIENLLYHPENIAAINPAGYDCEAWKNAIRESRPELHRLEAKSARSRIRELREVPGLKAQESSLDEIYDSYQSDDFEIAYRFTAMKAVPRTYLAEFNLSEGQLAQSPWFRQQIQTLVATLP